MYNRPDKDHPSALIGFMEANGDRGDSGRVQSSRLTKKGTLSIVQKDIGIIHQTIIPSAETIIIDDKTLYLIVYCHRHV